MTVEEAQAAYDEAMEALQRDRDFISVCGAQQAAIDLQNAEACAQSETRQS